MSAFGRLAKSALEHAFGTDAALRLAQSVHRGARLVLAYHNVVPGDRPPATGDTSLHLPLTVFAAQLDAIEVAGIRVVEIEDPISSSRREPQIALTFDDAYHGALHYAVPELAARGFPATVFVAPGLLGAPAPWWDLLADPELGHVPDPIRSLALGALEGDTTRIVREAATRGWAMNAPAPEHRIGSEADLASAMSLHAGLTFGAHSWGHPNLSSVAASRLHDELTLPLPWLRERWGPRVVRWLAYPYGLASREAIQGAASTAYRGAFLLGGGWHRRVRDPHTARRHNVSSMASAMGFRARLAGLR